MFTDFLYLLRAYGLPVGLVEWTALMDGLRLGLEKESLMEFYHMARAILVKRETDYDRFDQGRSCGPIGRDGTVAFPRPHPIGSRF